MHQTQNDGDANMMQLYNDAAEASVLRQMEEERRTARPDREPMTDKQIVGQEGSGADTSRGGSMMMAFLQLSA